METPVQRTDHINRTVLISLLASVGVFLGYTYWRLQLYSEGTLSIAQGSEYLPEWLGI